MVRGDHPPQKVPTMRFPALPSSQVRTSELLPLRGCVLEESIPALKSEKVKSMPTKDVLEFVCPELNLSG